MYLIYNNVLLNSDETITTYIYNFIFYTGLINKKIPNLGSKVIPAVTLVPIGLKLIEKHGEKHSSVVTDIATNANDIGLTC